MQTLLSPDDLKQSNKFRRLWSLYQQNVDLISVGAYERGSNKEVDDAIRLHDSMAEFLQQDMHKAQDYETTRDQIRNLMAAI
jgi:flagellum-specific ATP synthase